MKLGHVALLAIVTLGLGPVFPTAASADPPGPTDYVSEVISIDPPTQAFSVRLIGGDSFFELAAEPGHVVEVIGYRGELYLRFEADGTVLENQLSPSKYLNEERYGTDTGPAGVDPSAEPQWAEVASDGVFAWHDHRTHWMNDKRPVGASPGDRILEEVVPVIVDGEKTKIVVVSVLQPSPSPLGASLGLLVGLAGAAALTGWFSYRLAAVMLTLSASLALLVGAWATLSVPAETGPSMLGWVPPVLAIGSGVVAYGFTAKGRGPLAEGFLLIGCLELILWGWVRRSGVTSAVIPTNAPFVLDRFAVVSVALIGVVGLGLTANRMLRSAGAAGH